MMRDIFMEIEVLDTPPKYANEKAISFSQRQKLEEERKERLREALRENLRKRKEQMRARLKLLPEN
jgi:hypothetical protein